MEVIFNAVWPFNGDKVEFVLEILIDDDECSNCLIRQPDVRRKSDNH
jgi:hypothetical protein